MWITRWFIDLFGTMGGVHHFRLDTIQFHLLTLDVIGVALVGYFLNDWMDRPIDRINKPHRLLVRYSVSPFVFWIGISLLVASLGALSYWLAIETNHADKLWIFPLVMAGLVAYALWLRKFKIIGNLLVSSLVAALIGLVWLAEVYHVDGPKHIGRHPKLNQVLFIYASFMLLANWAREMIKDVEDVIGDKLNGVVSIATLTSKTTTYRISGILILSVIILEFYLIGLMGWKTIWSLGELLVLVVCAVALRMLYQGPEIHPPQRVSLTLKLTMFCGIIQLILFTV